jgi:hypothetical protein
MAVAMAPATPSQSVHETAAQEMVLISAAKSENVNEKHLRNGPHLAIERKSTLPLSQISLHLLSSALTCVILGLCVRNVYFADLTQPDLNMRLNAFQFVARFHEFLIAASMSSIVLYHLRYELVSGKGLPFGLVTSGFQVSSPQFLFQRSFWRAARSPACRTRTLFVATLLFLTATLTVLSGPSSAILVVPQINWWLMKDPFSSTGGQTFISGGPRDVWPASVNSSHVPSTCDPMAVLVDGGCPYASMSDLCGWASDWINNGASPNMTFRSSVESTRYLSASYVKNQTDNYAVASTAMNDQTKQLGYLWVYAQRHNLSMAGAGRPLLSMSRPNQQRVLKPLVQVECSDPYDISDINSVNVTFPLDQIAFHPSRVYSLEDRTIQINATHWNSRGHVQFEWTDLPMTGEMPVLGALVGMTFTNPQMTPYFPGLDSNSLPRALMACTMYSTWIPTSISLDPMADNIVILSDPDPADIVSSPDKMAETQDLYIDLSYAAAVNANLAGFDPPFTVMEYILRWFYLLAYQDVGYFDGFWGARWPWLIASMISLQMTDAVARITADESIAVVWHQDPSGSLSSDATYAMNINNMNHFYGLYDYPSQGDISFPDYARALPDRYTEIEWSVRRFGYAWSFHSITTYLATIVVLLHIVMVVAHTAIATFRCWRCRSWSTLLEMMALALQSPPNELLEGTTAGINDSETYIQRMRIRESVDGESVAMVIERVAGRFKGTGKNKRSENSEVSKYEKLKAGKKYL